MACPIFRIHYAEISQINGWDVRELGGEVTQMVKRLHMSQPGVAYSIRKGERILRDKNLQLKAKFLNYKWTLYIRR